MLILIGVLTSVGCQSLPSVPEEHEGAAKGAGVGAAAGTVAGAVFGGNVRSAVIGGLVGALLGGAVGHYAYDRKEAREETAQAYAYNESQGAVLCIEEASVSPQTAAPGDVVQVAMTYAVLNPSPGATTSLTEIREITYKGEVVGRPEVRVAHTDGTYTSTIPIRLPQEAKKGRYTVRAIVQTDTQKDTREFGFSVK